MPNTVLQVVELGLKYSKTLVSLFVFILSLFGYGLYDFVETTEHEKNMAVHEVATAFQKTLVETETKPISKPVYQRCTNLKSHIKEHHE